MSDKSSFDKSGFDKTGFDVFKSADVSYDISQTTTNPYPLYILDSDLNYIGVINAYRYLGWSRKYQESDGYTIEIDTNTLYSDLLVLGNFVVFKDETKKRIGVIEDIKYKQTKQEQILTISGRDPTGLFSNRIALYGTNTDDGYDDQSGNAETVILHYIDKNCIDADDPSRNLSGIALQTNQNRGEFVSYSARFQKIGEIVNELALSGEIGFETYLDKTLKKAVFNFRIGDDHSYISENPVIFKNDFKNILNLNINNSNVNNTNLAYVGGSGDGSTRTIREVYISSEPSDNERVELFVDANDLTTNDELDTRGKSEIYENQTQTSISAEIIPSGAFEYGVDYDLGDIVSIEFENIIYDLRIIEVLIEIGLENRRKITLTLGKTLKQFEKFMINRTKETPQSRS